MKRYFILPAMLLTLLLVNGCASGEKAAAVRPAAPMEDLDKMPVRTLYVEADRVLAGILAALPDYDLIAGATESRPGGYRVIPVRKGPQCDFREDILSLVVQAEEERLTRVHVVLDRGFLGRLSGEPDWMDAVFANILDRIQAR